MNDGELTDSWTEERREEYFIVMNSVGRKSFLSICAFDRPLLLGIRWPRVGTGVVL